MALVHVRNRETGEELHIGQEHLDRWPEDPYEVIGDETQPAPKANVPTTTGSTRVTPPGDRDPDSDF